MPEKPDFGKTLKSDFKTVRFYANIKAMSTLESYLNKIIHYGLYAILLTPLAFWPKALYPFATPKFILFQILVEIVFAAWLIFQLRNGFEDIKALKKNYLAIALLIFITISFISALLGVDFQRSFWGIGPRMTGLFAEIHFLVWFLILISYLKNDKEKWNNYLNFSFFVALAVAATSFYQNPKWVLTVGSTIFNNPTFVAPYFIFHFFWGLYKTIFNFQFSIFKLKGWFYGAGTILLFIAIILTQIRGALLGLLIGIFAFGFLLIFLNILNRRLRNILIAVYLIFAIGIAGFWSFRDSPLIQNISILKKIATASLAETTVRTRLLTWQLALKGFWDKPILGVGPENFNYLFNAHYNPHFLKFGGGGFEETWFDKPHNAFLEILSETGLVGSLAYVFIWVAISLALYKLFKKGLPAQAGEKFLSLILASAFIAYFSAVFFSFDSFGSWFGLFLFLAFLASHSNTNDNSNTNTRIHTNDTNGNFLKNIFVLFVCGVLFVLLYVNYSIWRANLADADALRAFPSNLSQGINLFKKSLNYFTPYKAEYQFDMAASVIGAIQKNISLPDLENNLNFTLDSIDGAIAAHPYNTAYYSDAIKLYNILGEKGKDPTILSQAEQFGEKAIKLSPNRQEIMFYLAQTALIRGDTKTAIQWTEKAVEVDPTIRQSHWYLGRLYFVAGRYQNAVAEVKKALDFGYKPQNKAEEEFIKNLGL